MPLRLLRRIGVLPPKPRKKTAREAKRAVGEEQPGRYSEDFMRKFSAILTRLWLRTEPDEDEHIEGGRKNSKDE
jgi:hypothetical protein